ncbi:carboxyl transferase domain-containing protein [Pseudonocardia ailaonensis]|uniref:Acetyl-coenzyme A carboxylase carboxyl transferase subunits beta/alpha n=1 Tax=Pseudonocardia ailaonensis TaxID=367279 RepID=A0ABN2NP80_9PSEU
MTTSARPRSLLLVDGLADEGTFRSWDTAPGPVPRAVDTPAYRGELAAARERSGADESVLTGEAHVGGHRVALVVNEFGFLAGSIGVAAAERLLAAVERATAQGLPLLAVTASGGTRMQEGSLAFLQMPAIAAAVAAHKDAGLLHVVYLRHPTTGGVLASWGSLGHLTVAEPGAFVGFLGPKVHAALHEGRPFPAGVQSAENLLAHGVVDAVVPAEDLAGYLAGLLAVVTARPRRRLCPTGRATPPADGPAADAWDSVTRTRRRARPGVRQLLDEGGSPLIPLGGSGRGEPADGLLVGLTCLGAAPCVLIGQDRAAQESAPLGPGSLRTARRAMRLAEQLGLPVVTVVDTPGAALSVAAEQGALAFEIGSCLADLADLAVPTLSVLLGQGSGGAALALLPADRVLAARHSWLSPLPPEGASVILHGTVTRGPQVVAAQQVRSTDLLRAGLVDVILDERPDAADEPAAFCRRVVAAVEDELLSAPQLSPAERRARRRDRYRGLTRL